MTKREFVSYESMFLALADSTRLALLGLMYNGPVSVGYLADTIGESQPKVSRHLAYLRNAGIVATRREGKRIYYKIQRHEDADLNGILDRVVLSAARLVGAEVMGTRDSSYNEYVEPYITEDAFYAGPGDDDDAFSPAGRGDEIEVYLL